MQDFGRILVIFGIIIIVVGLILSHTNISKHLGKLPGDINIKKGNTSFHFPIVTCILVSIILTVILNLILRK